MTRAIAHAARNGSTADAVRPCRVHLVRHGRTVLNVEVRFRGRLEIPLDEHGRREAWMAAHNLADAGLAAVYTSPLGRAREVARAISAVTAAPADDLDGLLNLDYGDWEGLTKEECARRDPEVWRAYRTAPEAAVCPRGEPLADAADRVIAALRWIGEQHPGQAVAAVTHGVMVRLAVLRAAPARGGEWEIKMPTGAAAVFDVRDGDVSLVSLPGDEVRRPVRVEEPAIATVMPRIRPRVEVGAATA